MCPVIDIPFLFQIAKGYVKKTQVSYWRGCHCQTFYNLNSKSDEYTYSSNMFKVIILIIIANFRKIIGKQIIILKIRYKRKRSILSFQRSYITMKPNSSYYGLNTCLPKISVLKSSLPSWMVSGGGAFGQWLSNRLGPLWIRFMTL